MNKFNELHAEQQDPFPVRVLSFIESKVEAHTAEEIAAHLAGVTGRYAAVISMEVQNILPTVKAILDELVAHRKVRKAVMPGGALGSKVLYARVESSQE